MFSHRYASASIRLKFYSHSSIKWKPVVEKFTNIQRLNKMHQHNQRAEEECKAVEELTNTHRIWQKQLWEGSSDAYTHEEFTRCNILYSKNEIKNRLRPKLEGGETDNNESRTKRNKDRKHTKDWHSEGLGLKADEIAQPGKGACQKAWFPLLDPCKGRKENGFPEVLTLPPHACRG